MVTRRQFLTRGPAALALAGTALAFPGENNEAVPPDGSAAKGMITPDCERAIESGLAFLRRSQHRDGSFGTNAYERGGVAITSLGGLAMMAGGHQPGRGPYGQVVTDALQFVMNCEQGNSGYLHNPIASPHGPMYGHGFGALFLAEAYGMVHAEPLRSTLRAKTKRSIDLILRSQNVEGGWRYTPGSRDADISVTICQIMALRSARNAGIAVNAAQVKECVKYVKRCQNRVEGSFNYQAQGRSGNGPAFARTAAGVCALFSAGIYKGPEVEAGLNYLMTSRPNGRNGLNGMHYFYGHYYAVQAMWTAGGEYWKEWFPAIRDELLSRQRPDGSWYDQFCSHYGTAMACIILQVPNNYLPILQK